MCVAKWTRGVRKILQSLTKAAWISDLQRIRITSRKPIWPKMFAADYWNIIKNSIYRINKEWRKAFERRTITTIQRNIWDQTFWEYAEPIRKIKFIRFDDVPSHLVIETRKQPVLSFCWTAYKTRQGPSIVYGQVTDAVHAIQPELP